ncbi:hypothetical protein TpMuguga_01g01170 [Theileria parva strain Muguga]|uniref:Uncharacterized protein n=1 Tax=Theileria parva TaxID=5875 RepID=Q4N6K0_THEPA|nr:uncharacterized protein TpMuguga_01g01170 [Theileria parva strain Muguga]EAN34408.1 hypothetical protein TpMuguga_01g01170 [Theileria parva strain Muguga]|eukprot:XP_766691.1 hypothetical protein [Theileria parva strain Muguga]
MDLNSAKSETLELDENDLILDRSYSKIFKATYYTRDEIPRDHLPYGLISNRQKYAKNSPESNSTDNAKDLDIKVWAREIYIDAIKYITEPFQPDRVFEWYHDFIALTNLQIAFHNYYSHADNFFNNLLTKFNNILSWNVNKELITTDEELESLSVFIGNQTRNLRSYVSKNAHLLIELLIDTINIDQCKILCYRIVPQLLTSTGSEKSVFREPSINNLRLIAKRFSTHFDDKILWQFMDQIVNLNKKISSTASNCAYEYLTLTDSKDLDDLDLSKLLDYFETGLNSKCVDAKRGYKRILAKMSDILTEKKYTSFLKESSLRPNLVKFVKAELPSVPS